MKKILIHLNKLNYIQISSAKNDDELKLVNRSFMFIYDLIDEFPSLPIPNYAKTNSTIIVKFFNTEKNSSIAILMYPDEKYKVIFNNTTEEKNASMAKVKNFIEEHIL